MQLNSIHTPYRNEKAKLKSNLPLNVFGMANIMSLGIFIPVVHNSDGCHVVEKFSRWQNPQVASSVSTSIPITKVRIRTLLVIPVTRETMRCGMLSQ